MITKLIRFDWAIKRILRDKANFVVLEGFLSVLLNETVTIQKILGSQANKEASDDKYNDVDILVENAQGELIIVEVQNTKEYDYFHRILFGTAKLITEYIKENKPYSDVKKVISIIVAYFDLGQGQDYIYHGTNTFKGIHKGDVLALSQKQKDLYNKQEVFQIYPEYWIIKAGLFEEEKVNNVLDEWVYFLKTGEVQDTFSAPGLTEAKEKLDMLKLSPEEREEYDAYIQRGRRLAGYRETEMTDAVDLIKQGVNQGKIEKEIELILEMFNEGFSISQIAKITKKSEDEIKEIIEKHLNK
jgi:predicted transposase/invertase (TIGR01784 family)